jgi:hypothetical protein
MTLFVWDEFQTLLTTYSIWMALISKGRSDTQPSRKPKRTATVQREEDLKKFY